MALFTNSLNRILFLIIGTKDCPETGKKKVVYNLKEANKAEAEAEAQETSCIADKGGDGDGNITLVVSVVGILNKELNHRHIFHGILVDKIVHCVFNVSLGRIDGVVDVAYIINLYHSIYVITGCGHFVSLLNEVRFVGIFAAPGTKNLTVNVR